MKYLIGLGKERLENNHKLVIAAPSIETQTYKSQRPYRKIIELKSKSFLSFEAISATWRTLRKLFSNTSQAEKTSQWEQF